MSIDWHPKADGPFDLSRLSCSGFELGDKHTYRVRGEWFEYVGEVDRLIGIFDKVPQKWSP